jgi:GR25 family glycosyltransferase involved in LPS biosynthesis
MIKIEQPINEIDLFWKRYYNFRKLVPCDMTLNEKYIKVVNLKGRRVCKWCYVNKAHKINIKTLMNREVSGKRIAPVSKSLSTQEFYNYFESFDRYLRRPDADEYCV